MDNMNETGEGSNLSKTCAKIDKSTQVNEQKEQKHLPAATLQPGRPSYLRKSSAWDNAFFTSAGLLEPHELSSMNKELDRSKDHLMPVILEDVRARRPNIHSISNTRIGLRDMDSYTRNNIDRELVFKRKNINDARPKRIKTQQLCKRSECNSLKLNHPKGPWERSNASPWQIKISRDLYSVDIEGKKKTGPGRNLMLPHSNTHTASVSSTMTPIRSSTKSKKFENLGPSYKSPTTTTIIRSMKSSLSTSSTNRAHSDSNRRLNMTSEPGRNVWPPSHFTRPVASVPSGLCMPSPKFGFFDEDISMERTMDGNSNQPQKQGMSESIDKISFVEALIKVKRAMNPISIDGINQDSMTIRLLTPIKSRYDASNARKYNSDLQSEYPTDEYIDIARKICAAEHDRKRVGLVNGTVKTKVETEKMVTKDDNTTPPPTPQSQTSWDRLYKPTLSMLLNQENEVNDWSSYLKFIDLNDGIETVLRQRKSFPCLRTSLVETKSVCNTSAAFKRLENN